VKTKYLTLISALLIITTQFGCTQVDSSSSEVSTAPNAAEVAEVDAELQPALELIRLSPDSSRGHTALASLYIRRARATGDFSINEKAAEAIKKALELNPADPSARKLDISLLATFHKFEEAREKAIALTRDFPKDAFAYGILVDANVEMGNYDEAVAAAQNMVDFRPDSSSFARVGQMRSLYGDHKGAVEALKKAARTADPQDKEALAWCLSALGNEYMKYGNPAAAEASFDEALGILPGYMIAAVPKAHLLAARGDLAAAANLITSASGTMHTDGYITLGDIATLSGDSAKAAVEYEKAEVAAKGPHGDAHRIALLWADQDIRHQEAVEIAEVDYQANKDIYSADIYAWTLYRQGRFVEAKQAIDRALSLKFKDARILYHAGMIEQALGNKQAGRRYLEQALKLDPNFDLIQARVAREALNGSS